MALASEGARVVVNYPSPSEAAKAKAVTKVITKLGGIALALQADVADYKTVRKMVQKAVGEFGGVDILVNNAGIAIGRCKIPSLEFNENEYDRMWNVNVKGVLYCTRAVAPHMIRNGYGKIVNNASVVGLGTAQGPIPAGTSNMSLYGSTKAAVIQLTKGIGIDLGRYGINVNAIAPGWINTDLSRHPGWGRVDEESLRYFRKISMLRRVGEPEEVARLILFLVSDESSFITGQVITIDGGRCDLVSRSA